MSIQRVGGLEEFDELVEHLVAAIADVTHPPDQEDWCDAIDGNTSTKCCTIS